MSRTVTHLGVIMGRRGLAPRPTALKLLHGVDKHNLGRVNRAEPQPDQGDITPPDWLSRSLSRCG